MTENRRDFLKKSSIAIAGASAITSAATSVTKAAWVSSDETIKIGLVGCGGRGRGAASQALTTKGPTSLVAMADAFDDQLQPARKMLINQHSDKVDVPEERQFVGFEAYKQLLEQDIDLIILATPPGFRPLHFEAAVNKGKHVFMEKPVAVDAAGVQRVLDATRKAKENDLLVQVGLQRRHETRYRETIKRLQDGAIGDINFMRAYWNGAGVWTRPRKSGQTEMQYQMRNWYYFNWLCGDHITEQHIHNLDVINWLKNGFPVEAEGMGGREVRTSKEHGEIFDHHMVEFTYADGSKMLSQCRHIPGCKNSVSEWAHGSKGTANISRQLIEMASGEKWKFNKKEMAPGEPGGHQNEHHDLFRDLRAGVLPNEGEYGAMSTMTSILGRMATYSGKLIKMDKALAQGRVVSPVDQFTTFDQDPPVMPREDMTYAVPIPGKTNVFKA
ncbi:MAG: Gfo/Idh/MocA family protein [Planctomycetaceae bacterium]